jgi:hypothetical protein
MVMDREMTPAVFFFFFKTSFQCTPIVVTTGQLRHLDNENRGGDEYTGEPIKKTCWCQIFQSEDSPIYSSTKRLFGHQWSFLLIVQSLLKPWEGISSIK